MDNPNPIRYSDLIVPDDSIKNLIAQLDALIAKYEGAKDKIQAAATEAARSMAGLSGATDEQRQSIAALSAESDKLAAHYAKYNAEEREVFRQKQSVIQATKEQERIDKLLVEINNSVEGSYKRLSAQYRLNKIRLNEMSAEQRRTAGVGKELEAETKRIYEEMSRLQKATGKYTLEVGHYENALRALPGPINQVVHGFSTMRGQLGAIAGSDLPLGAKALQGFTTVLSGTIGMVLLFVRHLTGSYKTMRDFEQATANLSTILGTTRDDMQALTESALSLGRTTEYTARQVVELQTELAKLGFGEGSIIAMQNPILQFATAVGANLADAAQVAGSTLRAFNLASADTEEVLATLAAATNKSALSFDRIKQSIGTVFPVASAFGLSVKDTTALLGSLANAGFDASTAATATRNIILRLADANGKLAQMMGGPARTFDDFVTGLVKLRKAGVDLNDALELTDRRSVAAFAAFMSGAEAAKELRANLEDVSGELDRIQSERLNTVEGATKLLKSAWEGLTLAFQESNGTIRESIEWLTKLVGAIQKVLFPAQTAAANWADSYTKSFQKVAQDAMSENGALTTIGNKVEELRKRVKDSYADLAKASPFSAARRRRIYEDAEAELQGALRAQAVVQDQLRTQQEERERIAARAAEEAELAAKGKKEELTKEQKRAADAAKKQRIADLRAVVEAINLEISVTEAGTEEMLTKRLDKVEAERRLELEMNAQKVASERQAEAAINAKYDKQAIDTRKAYNNEVSKLAVQRLQAEQQAIQLEIAITEDGTDEMLRLRMENLEKQEAIEIEQNKQKETRLQQDEKKIRAKYESLRLRERADFDTKLAERDLKAAQEIARAEFEMLDKNERQKTIFRLDQEAARLEAVLELNKTARKKMTKAETESIRTQIAAIKKEKERLGYDNVFEVLGISITGQQQDALNEVFSQVKGALGDIAKAWRDAADAALSAADAQVDAAQKTLDAEIEARNAGYANQVQTAQKELALAQSNRQRALREQEQAQRAQLALDSVTQASSLITASANIWKAFAGIPVLAIAALATMWTSFAAAKVKAFQATEKYGEGTVELLQGGSHASGHDIDLGTKPDGTRRRAEGGEYFAVINKKNSRRYRGIIPDVINSLNNGTFADKYQRASARMSFAATDVSRLESDVSAIRKQGEEIRFVDGRGNTIVKYKNLTRRIAK